ncbi:X-ray radiation resistance-associated protein 1 isoform X1 [Embiotoca jacksoni]|uniref:X-ray radiation resistance-associated protein 1 isoform X1 n=2 Tax=Embiotoca jacksoni TaxID=100190 RepID=UPI0037037D84
MDRTVLPNVSHQGHRRRKDGSGHWLLAYQKEEEQRYRNVNRRIKATFGNCENRTPDGPRGVILDELLLLQLHCVDHPSKLCFVDVSEKRLTSVKSEDFKVFVNVAYIDASINSLSLGSFSSFVSLRELNLSLNGICNMAFSAADFPYLELLDLSYNSVSAVDIVSLGRLPLLKVLHLTGNKLLHLPPDLGSSYHDPTQLPAEEGDTQFKALEALMLDDNKLSSGVFSSLINLKRLKYLNLQRNCISEIPYMQLMNCSKPVDFTEKQEEEEGVAITKSNPNTDKHLKKLSQMFHEDIWEEFSHGSDLPLPELQFLNLADNKIAEEEALVAATLFPMLREIDIQSNPLTTKRRGEPPLLSYIRERLGITTKRKKTQEAVKLPLKVLTNPRWKVHKKIPKVSKNPLLMNTTRAAQIQTDKSEVVVKRTRGSEGKESSDPAIHENTEHFFITQTADAPEFERDVPSEEKETANNEEPTSPEQFTCYKMSTDAKPNPNASKLVGTQTAVRMPEHAQKKLNVYRDSKPELDSIQTPNGEKEKRIKKLPPLKPIKQPAERVDEMMKVMKENTTIKTVPLAVVLCGAGVNKEEYKEALSLLRELKTKYKRVHKKTMERAARQSLTETKTELNLHL